MEHTKASKGNTRFRKVLDFCKGN